LKDDENEVKWNNRVNSAERKRKFQRLTPANELGVNQDKGGTRRIFANARIVEPA
jgi:hypothetical protein